MLRLLWPLAAVVAFAEIVAPLPAHAERPPEPGAIERTVPTESRRSANAPVVALPQRESGGQSAALKRFTLGAVNIDGATVFSQQELSSTFEAYLATEVDQAKLAQMAQAITARYRQTGYLLSYAMVPQQNVDAGMVRLAVVEGRIDKVSVQGAGSAHAAIEAIAAPLLNGQPVRGASLERTIGLIRDFPGVTVGDIALMRSDAGGGRYTLKISVVPDRFRAFTYADNRGTGSIGHSRVYNSFSLSSLAIQGDELRVDLFAMPGRHSHYLYGQALAALPIGRSGMKFQLSASRGDQYLRADERFNGQSDNAMAQLSYPFLRSRALTLMGKTSLTDWRSVGKLAGARRLRDRLRVARLGLEVSNEGLTHFQGELLLSRGLGFGGMTQVGDPLASRPDASGRFTKLTASAQVSRQVSDRITLRGTAMAQYSDQPLLSAEEFSLGGNRLGRAYRFNARTGDRGAGAGIEVGYRLGKSDSQTGAELFGFADGGVAVDLRSAISPSQKRSLGSVGVGTRFSIAGMSAAVEAGFPLGGNRHSPRLFASLFHAF
ncbi:MAG: ShlB/FhaC/HecB family hemolysin secretion/activation protein [Sphingomicrobium sp.]